MSRFPYPGERSAYGFFKPERYTWKGAASTIPVTQNTATTLKFSLANAPTPIQAISFFAHPGNLNSILLGTQEVFFINPAGPLVTPAQGYAVLPPGQSGRAYVTDPDDYFDLAEWWVMQVSQANTNFFSFTVWSRIRT